MSGVLVSCCNTGNSAHPLVLAYYDLETQEIAWVKLDDVPVNVGQITGSTGLIRHQDNYFLGLQGIHAPAAVLRLDRDLRCKDVIRLPGVRDIHSLRAYGTSLYAASSGTDELYVVDLENGETRCHFRFPLGGDVHADGNVRAPGRDPGYVHLNDYIQFQGKEYVLGHTNPFGDAMRRNGFVYCLTDRKVVVDELEHPHTLMVLNERLAVLDSARALVLYVDDGPTKPWLKVSGGWVLRGACQHDNFIYLAMSSRRLFSRKRGMLKLYVDDNEDIIGNEIYMSWLYCFDKAGRALQWRRSLTEVTAEVYDLAYVAYRPAEDRLMPHAAALRAQWSRVQEFEANRRTLPSTTVGEPRAKADQSAKLWDLEAPQPQARSAMRAEARKQGREQAQASIPANSSGLADWDKEETHYHVVKAPNSSKTIIAFAGLAQLVGGMMPYNFMQSLSGVDANLVFVRDPKRTWFNGPIAGIGVNASEIVAKLKSIVAELRTEELYMVGTSSGGFAALAFAGEMGAKRVLAFGPQTNIDLDYLNSVGETRWLRIIARITKPQLTDVAQRMRNSNGCRFDLVIGSRIKLDVEYAERLRDIPQVEIHYVFSKHNSAMHLKNSGVLTEVLHQFASEAPLVIPASSSYPPAEAAGQ
jgi:hypothetical protein